MHWTTSLTLVMATLVLLPQRVLSNSCCFSFVSKTTTNETPPTAPVVKAVAHPSAGLVLASAPKNPTLYIITLTATPQYIPSIGVATSISFPKTFGITVLPKGCSYFALYGVSCNLASPADTITVFFPQVIGEDTGPARFDSVVMNGDVCTVASSCSPAIPSPLPPAAPPPSNPPVPSSQPSGIGPPVVSPPLGGSKGPTTLGSQPTNLPGTETGGRNDGAHPTASSSSNSGTGEPHMRKSETGMIVGSTVGAAALVLLSSLVIIRRQKRVAAAAAAAAASAASSTKGSPSIDPRRGPWEERPSRVATAAAALWAALMDPKRMSPRIPTMTAPWHRINLTSNTGAGAGTDLHAEKNPSAVLERRISIETASDQSSVFGILDAYATQEKDGNWPNRENSISRNPALAAAVSAVKDLSVAAAAGKIRHEKIKKTGAGVGVGVDVGAVIEAGVSSGSAGTTQPLVYLPDSGTRSQSSVHLPDSATRGQSSVHLPDSRSQSSVHLPDSRSQSSVHLPDSRSQSSVHLPDSRSQSLVHLPDSGTRTAYEYEDDQLDFKHGVDYHLGLQDVVLAPSTNVSSELTIVSEPSTPPSVPSSPLLSARARLFQAVTLASARLRQEVSRHSWYGSPIQTHAEVAAVEEEQQQQQQQQQPQPQPQPQLMKAAGPRYPKDNIASTQPVKGSLYKRHWDSNTSSGIFVTSMRADHHNLQFQEDRRDDHEPLVQSADELDFTSPDPPRMLPTQPSITTNPTIVRTPLYDDTNINNSDSQLYKTNLNNFRNSTARRGFSQPIVMRSEEIRIVREEPPRTPAILPVKPPSRYSRNSRAVPSKYEESSVFANGLYGFM